MNSISASSLQLRRLECWELLIHLGSPAELKCVTLEAGLPSSFGYPGKMASETDVFPPRKDL